MKVLTYNIWMIGKSTQEEKELTGRDRIPQILEVIKQEDPDVVCLQEANHFEDNDAKLLHEFRKELNLPRAHVALGTQRSRGRYNVAILSRYGLQSKSEVDGMHHAALQIYVDSPLGRLSLCTTHLSPRNEPTRLSELELITQGQEKDEDRLIMGDLNFLAPYEGYEKLLPTFLEKDHLRKMFVDEKEQVDYRCHQFLTSKGYVDLAQWRKINEETTHTTPASPYWGDGLVFRIDYVWGSPSLAKKVKDMRVIKTELSDKASDHYPIVVEFEE